MSRKRPAIAHVNGQVYSLDVEESTRSRLPQAQLGPSSACFSIKTSVTVEEGPLGKETPEDRIELARVIREVLSRTGEPATREIRKKVDAAIGPGKHTYETIARAMLAAMIEVGDEQHEELARLLREDE